MRERISDTALDHLFAENKGLPCPKGTALLRAFAEQRPADFAFLQPHDLMDLQNSAFTGIPAWDAFSDHFATCERCNA
jgi:hypothetical protein